MWPLRRLFQLPAPCHSRWRATAAGRRSIFGFGEGDERPPPAEIDFEPEERRRREQQKEAAEAEVELRRIRARGVLKTTRPYQPPSKAALETQLIDTLRSSVDSFDTDNWRDIDLSRDPYLKFKLLVLLESRLGRSVPNSLLHTMGTAGDVADFYATPADNVGPYAARRQDSRRPANLHMIGEMKEFHPEDTDEYHGGVTAFPGQDGRQPTLRRKRVRREFKARRYWYDYLDPHFDHSAQAARDAPWLADAARQYTRLRHVGPKTF